MVRSGTTLLEKMLGSHPQIDILSQPLPLLYRHLKEKFYQSIDYPETYYVLNNLFNEKRYTEEDFTSFLKDYCLTEEELKKIVHKMQGWSGQKTSLYNWENNMMEELESGTLFNWYKQMLDEYCLSTGEVQRGSKEVLVEEFVPHFINHDMNVLVIVRDPRDVITSLNFGKGTEYAGEYRPTLFHLRNWRKSVAIINTFAHEENFHTVRYEDLIQMKPDVLNGLIRFLEIQDYNFSSLNNKILNRDGKEWQGNSSTTSFNGIDSSNMEKYKNFLSAKTIRYIEFMCQNEMKTMGYELENNCGFTDYDPSQYKENCKIENVGMDPNMSIARKELDMEFQRQRLLNEEHIKKAEIFAFFYSMKNYKVLKKYN